MEPETFLTIPELSQYEVGNLGSIISLKRGKRRTMKLNAGGRGYLLVNLFIDGKAQSWYVHHLVALAHLGPRPNGYEICHNNGIQTDNRAENLRYDTPAGNQADKVKHGTGITKLTVDQVIEIRRAYAEGGVLQRELGDKYGVTSELICRIINRKKWRHVQDK